MIFQTKITPKKSTKYFFKVVVDLCIHILQVCIKAAMCDILMKITEESASGNHCLKIRCLQ